MNYRLLEMTPFILQKYDKFIKSIYALHVTAKINQNHVDDPQNVVVSLPLVLTNVILETYAPISGK